MGRTEKFICILLLVIICTHSYLIVGSKCHVLQLKFLQSIRSDVSISTFSLSTDFEALASFLLPTMCRKSASELFMFDAEDALDKFVKFLELPAAVRWLDPAESVSLVIERVDEPMFVDDTSKLFVAWLPAAADRLGEPERAF